MQQGRVKKFSPDRRFGQIRPDSEKIGIFFHRDDVIGVAESIFSRGAHVSFVVIPDVKHPGSQRAAQVTLIEETPEEKEKRERIQTIKEKGRQIRHAQIEAAKEKEKQIKLDRKIEIEQVGKFAQKDERKGRFEDSTDRKPAYIVDRDLEDYFLSVQHNDN